MTKQPVSEEMLNAFVDRQLSSEDRLRVLRELADDGTLGRAVCDRQQLKALVGLAYPQPARVSGLSSPCDLRALRWWRRVRGERA
jgi:anti-sigma factor RsiW